jgi:hypothetical protein
MTADCIKDAITRQCKANPDKTADDLIFNLRVLEGKDGRGMPDCELRNLVPTWQEISHLSEAEVQAIMQPALDRVSGLRV